MSGSVPLSVDEAEAKRLAALEVYDILDTPSEPGFDDIVRIASQICGTPMALISLVDDRRQWFKAAVGIDEVETPREIAFCAHAIEQRDIFTVQDAAADERFVANPLVTGENHLRFYAGAPLVTPEGFTLGTLCVLDREPRTLSTDQLSALQALARQVMAQLELRRAVARHEADERHRQLLVDELRHRSRNTLAVVQAIVAQSLRGIEGTAEARQAITERLVAMADAHDLLGRSDWTAASITDVITSAISAVAGQSERIRLTGPDFQLSPRAALSLSMALHELTTNAAKYGALSNGSGQLSVDWHVDPQGALMLEWRETGGPPVTAPTRRGFGTQLTTSILPRELGGTGVIDHAPDGVRWTMTTMLDRISVAATG